MYNSTPATLVSSPATAETMIVSDTLEPKTGEMMEVVGGVVSDGLMVNLAPVDFERFKISVSSGLREILLQAV